MLRQLSSYILRRSGWKMVGGFPYDIKKTVILIAPHTSNMDYIIGRLFFFKINVHVKFLIKKEAFFFPFGGLIRYWGGIPVDRRKNNRMVDRIAEEFKRHESLYVVVTPEGTRKLITYWRRGFYYIAMKAGVPLALSFIDYSRKEVGIMEIFYPTGSYANDLKYIENLYRDKVGRHPEQFNLYVKEKKRKGD